MIISTLTIPYDPQFFDEPEAIWNFWNRGNYCDKLALPPRRPACRLPVKDPDIEIVQHVEITKNYNNLRYVYVPVCKPHEGIYEELDQHIRNVKFENQDFGQKTIDEIFTELKSEWYKDLLLTIAQETHSPLGKAVAQFNACARLLSLVSNIVLTDKTGTNLFTEMQKDPEFIFDQNELTNYLESDSGDDIAKRIVPKLQTQAFLKKALEFLQKTRWDPDFPSCAGVNVVAELLACMDLYVEKMKMGPCVSDQVIHQEKLIKAMGAVFMRQAQGLSALCDETDPDVLRAGIKTLALHAQQHYTMHEQLTGGITSSEEKKVPLITPITSELPQTSALTGYARNGLMGRKETSKDADQLPIRGLKLE